MSLYNILLTDENLKILGWLILLFHKMRDGDRLAPQTNLMHDSTPWRERHEVFRASLKVECATSDHDPSTRTWAYEHILLQDALGNGL